MMSISAIVFKQLLYTRLTILKKNMLGKTIDLYIWAFCTTTVASYILQAMGLASDFGMLQFGSVLITAGLFEVYGNVILLTTDFEGNKTISYYLALPASALITVLHFLCYYIIVGMFLSLSMIPLGKIVLWNSFALTQIHWGKLLLIVLFSNVFFSAITLMLASKLKTIERIGAVWMRVIFPLWFFGGLQFSFDTIHQLSPTISYFFLLNPVIYIVEGTRAALTGQVGMLPFWLCLSVIGLISGACTYLGYIMLKKRLDFV